MGLKFSLRILFLTLVSLLLVTSKLCFGAIDERDEYKIGIDRLDECLKTKSEDEAGTIYDESASSACIANSGWKFSSFKKLEYEAIIKRSLVVAGGSVVNVNPYAKLLLTALVLNRKGDAGATEFKTIMNELQTENFVVQKMQYWMFRYLSPGLAKSLFLRVIENYGHGNGRVVLEGGPPDPVSILPDILVKDQDVAFALLTLPRLEARSWDLESSLANNKQFMTKVLLDFPKRYSLLSAMLKDDFDVLAAIIEKCPGKILEASERLKKDKKIMNRLEQLFENKQAVDRIVPGCCYGGVCISRISSQIRSDKPFVIRFFSRQPFELQFAPVALRDDLEVVKVAVEKEPSLFKFATDRVHDSDFWLNVVCTKNRKFLPTEHHFFMESFSTRLQHVCTDLEMKGN